MTDENNISIANQPQSCLQTDHNLQEQINYIHILRQQKTYKLTLFLIFFYATIFANNCMILADGRYKPQIM